MCVTFWCGSRGHSRKGAGRSFLLMAPTPGHTESVTRAPYALPRTRRFWAWPLLEPRFPREGLWLFALVQFPHGLNTYCVFSERAQINSALVFRVSCPYAALPQTS